MRVTVYGLWHLGCVTAACIADAGHDVVGLDLDGPLIDALKNSKPPLDEPGLVDLIGVGLKSEKLRFTNDPADALQHAEVLWVTFDTPLNDRDEADVAFVWDQLGRIKDHVRPGTLVLISSQVPVSFTRALSTDWDNRDLRFGISPENLRIGKALEGFRSPERIVVGLSHPEQDREFVTRLFTTSDATHSPRIEWMSLESAEMTKHAINAFLAVSVSFINELARLCEAVGADAKEVERGLKSEGRIGPRAYLSPGAAFAGGTLARDLNFLIQFGKMHHAGTPLLDGVVASNNLHEHWTRVTVMSLLRDVSNPVVAILGLTYKPGTSTLRRSAAISLAKWLQSRGVTVRAHDPMIHRLPDEFQNVASLFASAPEALDGADVSVIGTEWPQFRALSADSFVSSMRHPRIVDPNWFLAGMLSQDSRITYVATGHRGERG
jgi:UDPglucose 6-dehydrogenase